MVVCLSTIVNVFAYRVDMVFKRGKNANRIASSRLRAAELLMLNE